MSSLWWERLSAIGHGVNSLLRTAELVQRARRSLAGSVREVADAARSAAGAYLSMLVLLGMVTAGFVLLPLGLLLLGHRLVSEAADKPLVAGIILSLVGLFYLVAPLAVLRAVSNALCDRFQHKADRLAERIEGQG